MNEEKIIEFVKQKQQRKFLLNTVLILLIFVFFAYLLLIRISNFYAINDTIYYYYIGFILATSLLIVRQLVKYGRNDAFLAAVFWGNLALLQISLYQFILNNISSNKFIEVAKVSRTYKSWKRRNRIVYFNIKSNESSYNIELQNWTSSIPHHWPIEKSDEICIIGRESFLGKVVDSVSSSENCTVD